MDAGRGVTDLLMRNFLKAYGVWWFPPLVIQLGAFMLSAAWGAALYAMTYFALADKQQGHMVRTEAPSPDSGVSKPCV